MPEGKYDLSFTLTDSLGFPRSFSIQVDVPKKQPKPVMIEPVRGDWKLPPPVPRIKFIDMKGRVRVTFSRKITIPTFQIYPEFTDAKHLRQGCDNGSVDVCKAKAEEAKRKKAEEDARKKAEASCAAGFIADCKMADQAN